MQSSWRTQRCPLANWTLNNKAFGFVPGPNSIRRSSVIRRVNRGAFVDARNMHFIFWCLLMMFLISLPSPPLPSIRNFKQQVERFHQLLFDSWYYYQQDFGFDRCFSDGSCIILFSLPLCCFHLPLYAVVSWQVLKPHHMEERRRGNECFERLDIYIQIENPYIYYYYY